MNKRQMNKALKLTQLWLMLYFTIPKKILLLLNLIKKTGENMFTLQIGKIINTPYGFGKIIAIETTQQGLWLELIKDIDVFCSFNQIIKINQIEIKK
jgi:hypothetical protein